MQNDWFFDVLTDLKAFAEANELCAVAAKLEEVRRIAEVEMPEVEKSCGLGTRVSHETTGLRRLH